MELTSEELKKYVYDPTIIQHDILEYVSKASDGDLNITNPTNPFVMLMETAAVTSANAAIESKSVIRAKYPSLAIQPHELYHHITDNELDNMFSTPSVVNMLFYINLMDLKNNGYTSENGGKSTIIPKGTAIEIAGVTFTILNDIYIKVNSDNTVFVEHRNNEDPISIKDLGILKSAIITDAEGIPWVLFESYIKQIRKVSVSKSIIALEGFKHDITINDSYYYSNIRYKNSLTNNEYVNLSKRHNEEYIDETTPSVYISVFDKNIRYQIPDIYLANGMISGNINIDVYDTKGKLYLPVNKFTFNDFKITLGDTTTTPEAATIKNIALIANSRDIVNGGKNALTLEELRDSIIHNTTGNNNLPITSKEIEKSASFNGYDVFKALDVVTDRIYIASKNTPYIDSKLIYSKIDTFFNTVNIILSEVSSNNVLNNNDTFIIKSNTIFKEINSIVTVVNDDDLDYVNKLSNVDKTRYFKDHKYFFTPYYYIVDKTDGETDAKVYDLDSPKLENLSIIGKNINIPYKVNTDKYTVIKTNTGYKVIISLITNKEFKQINPDKIKGELTIDILSGGTTVNIPGEYNAITGYMEFNIDTDFYVDRDNFIEITNGISEVYTKKVKLINTITIYIYTTELTVTDEVNYLRSEIVTESKNTNVVVFSKEKIDLLFGNELTYIWSKLYNTYTERKYKRYTTTIYKTYSEDVYSVDPTTGSKFKITTDTDGKKVLTSEIIHHKGDYILDSNGDKVILYKSGDVILDTNNKPIIDTMSGLSRNIDILMLEYEFKLATTLAYKNYLISDLDLIRANLLNDMSKLNDKVLENTKILYKSYKSSKLVSIIAKNSITTIPYITKPSVILYITDKSYYNPSDLDNIYTVIGKIIHEHLDKTDIVLTSIKEDIMNSLAMKIVAIKITGLDNVGDTEAFTIQDKTRRLTLDKKLVINNNNELIVKYNIDISVEVI